MKKKEKNGRLFSNEFTFLNEVGHECHDTLIKMIKFCFLFSVTGLCVGIGFGISSKVYEDVKSVAKEPCKFDLIINYDHFELQLFVYFASDVVLFADEIVLP